MNPVRSSATISVRVRLIGGRAAALIGDREFDFDVHRLPLAARGGRRWRCRRARGGCRSRLIAAARRLIAATAGWSPRRLVARGARR